MEKQPTTVFLTIPGELRNHIHEILIPTKTVIKSAGIDPIKLPPIAQVCKQIRQEILSLYYGNNIFHLATALYTCDAARRATKRRISNQYHFEWPSYRNSPISILTHWIAQISLPQFAHVREIHLRINDTYPEVGPYVPDSDPPESIHRATVILRLPGTSYNLAQAEIEVHTEPSFRRFRRDTETPGYRGQIGSKCGNRRGFKGCAPFNLFLFRYLSSQEPVIERKQEVVITNEGVQWGYGERVELQYDEHERDAPYEDELIPPRHFFPTSNIFTVLSVLDDAMQYHCCCCMKEPATKHPMRANGKPRLSFDDDPFSLNNNPDPWPMYCDDKNWTALEAAGLVPKQDDPQETERQEEMDNDDEQGDHRGHRVFENESRLLDALMLAGYDFVPRYAKARSYLSFCQPWKEARSWRVRRMPQRVQLMWL